MLPTHHVVSSASPPRPALFSLLLKRARSALQRRLRKHLRRHRRRYALGALAFVAVLLVATRSLLSRAPAAAPHAPTTPSAARTAPLGREALSSEQEAPPAGSPPPPLREPPGYSNY